MMRSAGPTHAYSIFDTEIERRGPGAIVLLGLKSPLEFNGYNLSPPTTVFTEAAHRQGGYVDAEKLVWRDIAALIALGQVDFAGLVTNSYTPYGVETDIGNTRKHLRIVVTFVLGAIVERPLPSPSYCPA